MYTIEYTAVDVSMDELKKYYKPNQVIDYCKECPSYGKLWSCPPHDFSTFDFLSEFRNAKIISGKIVIDKSQVNINTLKEDVGKIFFEARKEFSDNLISQEADNSVAFIAGNCYKCSDCTRLIGGKCIKQDKMRYSLESVGFFVSDITSNILNQEIQWVKDSVPDYLITVGALFYR